MNQYIPMMVVMFIILGIILFSIQYTLNMILKELRSIRITMEYSKGRPRGTENNE